MKVISCLIRMHDTYTMRHGIQRTIQSICMCSALRKRISKTVCFFKTDKIIGWAHYTEGTSRQAEEKGDGTAEWEAPLPARWPLGRVLRHGCPAIAISPAEASHYQWQSLTHANQKSVRGLEAKLILSWVSWFCTANKLNAKHWLILLKDI